ncbi:MAG: serine/threonine protein kinase [Phycisphaerae bacterium]|jgi:Tfp pilus assembly protein PilF/tRNA A-37 threonylcarbamoyl transferase component Bud32
MSIKEPTSARDNELIADAARQIASALRCGASATPIGSSTPPASPAPAGSLTTAEADAIPGYRIVGERQRGGQGVVYEAIQRATRRRVAIKVLHERQVGGASRARFEREVEILAQLRHPNIVTIHDSACTDRRLYYVMDFIDGVPFDEFAGGVHDRDPRLLLPVFVKVCDAVHAAHLRGVMHRDLKPGNILVDAAGEPHVLDFGLAKWLDSSDMTAAPQMTLTGQFLGSLLWAAPEQIEGAHDRLDIRCDVYSLGVILCQTLTGRLPYPQPGTLAEAARHIRESEPLRPSTLRRGLNDELDTIVLKCLQKDPQRRYQTAGELGRDIRRYLAHEPIEAKRDSVIYLLRKRLRRNRVVVGASGAIMLACAAGLVASLLLWRGAERQRIRAEESERLAARRAEEARRVAEFQATLFERIDPEVMGRDLLDSIRRHVSAASAPSAAALLAEFDPALNAVRMTDVARETIARTLLEPAEQELESQFADQPAIEARLRDTLADLYRQLGHFADSERNVRRALELKRQLPDEDLAESLNRLGVILRETGDVSAAEAAQRAALEYAERHHGPQSPQTAIALDNLAALLGDRGDFDAAETLVRRALAIWTQVYHEQHPDTLTCLNQLAVLLLQRDKLAEAEPIAARVLETRRATLKANDPLIAGSLRNLALIQYSRGDFDSAEANLREALQVERDARGNEHPDVAASMNALAMLLMARGALDDAELLFRDALAMQRQLLGDVHPDTATTLGNLGALLSERGDFAAAIPALREAMAAWAALYGDDSPDVARVAGQLAEALLATGDAVDAEPLLRRALAHYESAKPDATESITRTRLLLARVLIVRREFALAERELLAAESAASRSSTASEKFRRLFSDLYDSWEAADPEAGRRARAAHDANPAAGDPASQPNEPPR